MPIIFARTRMECLVRRKILLFDYIMNAKVLAPISDDNVHKRYNNYIVCVLPNVVK